MNHIKSKIQKLANCFGYTLLRSGTYHRLGDQINYYVAEKEALTNELAKLIQKLTEMERHVQQSQGTMAPITNLQIQDTVNILSDQVAQNSEYIKQLFESMGGLIEKDANDSKTYNSRYVDRFPLVADDFQQWSEDQIPAQFDMMRDRENHRLYDLVMGCFASYGVADVGDYHEYGVCGAGQFRLALSKAKKWGLSNMNFFAFDSFKGLPTDGSLAMSHEMFWESIKGAGVNTEKVRTIQGFFQDSLTIKLQSELIAKGRPLDFVNIDCDLDESARSVFKFISPMIRPGTVIYLDDFFSTFKAKGNAWGTARAFADFAESHELKFYPFVRSGWWGLAFIAYDPNDYNAKWSKSLLGYGYL